MSNLGKSAIMWIISIGNLRGKQLLVILRMLIMVRVNTETLKSTENSRTICYLLKLYTCPDPCIISASCFQDKNYIMCLK